MEIKAIKYRTVMSDMGIVAGAILLLIWGCQKLELLRMTKVSTNAATNIEQTRCELSGTLVDIAEEGVQEYGHCWSTNSQLSLTNNDNCSNHGASDRQGEFTTPLSGLQPATLYYYRAYARQGDEEVYGAIKSFTTLNSEGELSITTTAVTQITNSTAQSGGSISNSTGSSIAARGVCWSTQVAPLISDNSTNEGPGEETFTSSITGLSVGTTYYLRAYATDENGTHYGNELSFQTTAPPQVSTHEVTAISFTSAQSGGEITDDGGSPILDKGVCWSTSPAPDINDHITAEGSGSDAFSSSLSGLYSGTRYYVRAYASNANGTGYGEERSFSTEFTCGTTFTDSRDSKEYATVGIGDQCWFAENLATDSYTDQSSIPLITDDSEWVNLSTPAYCWYENDASTFSTTYGALYNGFAAATEQLCPSGWHVPTDDEWKALEMYLGMTQSQADAEGFRGTDQGSKLKEAGTTHWMDPNEGATNQSGFTALPGGYRFVETGAFQYAGSDGYYWTSTTDNSGDSLHFRVLVWYNEQVLRGYQSKNFGFSVRCIRD